MISVIYTRIAVRFWSNICIDMNLVDKVLFLYELMLVWQPSVEILANIETNYTVEQQTKIDIIIYWYLSYLKIVPKLYCIISNCKRHKNKVISYKIIKNTDSRKYSKKFLFQNLFSLNFYSQKLQNIYVFSKILNLIQQRLER